MAKRIDVSEFGTTKSGHTVRKFAFSNEIGTEVQMLDYGATVNSVKVPDRSGNLANVNLGCPDVSSLEANQSYLGATLGRFAGRIGGASFSIDGSTYRLTANNGSNTLHGGADGFNRKIWNAEPIERDTEVGVRFSLNSNAGDEGFPGNLQVTVEYLLNDDNELSIEYAATTDAATHINLTNHCYWNLSGAGQGDVYDHHVQINSDQFIEANDEGIPTGTLSEVDVTPLDFRSGKLVGDDIEQLPNTPQGYDHTYVLNSEVNGSSLKVAATVAHFESGRHLQIKTDQPALQLYTANYMNGTSESAGFKMHSALALETQGFPDAPNHADFPSTLLVPGKSFRSKTVLKFWAEQQ